MTEDDARAWIRDHWGVSRETLLAELERLVRTGSAQQNLVAASTLDLFWSRHVVDSAQLLRLGKERSGAWLDIGTGAGFPGLVIACLRDQPITLCEPRKLRADFLSFAATQLGLAVQVDVAPCKCERLAGTWPLISARAVARLDALLDAAHHLSDPETLWLLPKGRSGREEVATARKSWHGSFHVEQSLTQPDSIIVVASGVARR